MYTQAEIMENKPNITIKNKKNMHTDRCENTRGQKCHAKEAEKKVKCRV
jgi:hypothetical protein